MILHDSVRLCHSFIVLYCVIVVTMLCYYYITISLTDSIILLHYVRMYVCFLITYFLCITLYYMISDHVIWKYTMQYDMILCYVIISYYFSFILLYYIISYFMVSYHIILHSIMLYYAKWDDTIEYDIIWYSMI